MEDPMNIKKCLEKIKEEIGTIIYSNSNINSIIQTLKERGYDVELKFLFTILGHSDNFTQDGITPHGSIGDGEELNLNELLDIDEEDGEDSCDEEKSEESNEENSSEESEAEAGNENDKPISLEDKNIGEYDKSFMKTLGIKWESYGQY